MDQEQMPRQFRNPHRRPKPRNPQYKSDGEHNQWEFDKIFNLMLNGVHNQWDYATSRLFIVLPSDRDSWIDSEPSTHKFHLYFLCDMKMQFPLRERTPPHVHLSNHPGYNLIQPHLFFDAYGDYVLQVLRMVKIGFSNMLYEIPPLGSFKILWNCDSSVTGNSLSKNNIGPLIDMAIYYLDGLDLPKWADPPELTRTSSAAINAYLDVQDGNNSLGNLHCYIDPLQRMTWVCQTHSHQLFLHKESLEGLTEFVCLHGGYVDMQRAMISVELGSTAEADQFLTLLTTTKHTFNISLKLMWRAKQQHIEELCQKIAWTGTVLLEIDGIAPGIQPLGPIQHRVKMAQSKSTNIRLVRLLNYPGPSEQCLFMENCEVQLSSSRSSYDWVEVQRAVVEFGEAVNNGDATTAECKLATRQVRSALVNYGLSEIAKITVYNGSWDGVFRLDEGSFVEMNTINLNFPKVVVASGRLRKMTVHLLDVETDKKLYDMAQEYTLKELNISTEGRNVLNQMEHLFRLRYKADVPRRHTLLERTESSRGRVVAEIAFSGRIRSSLQGRLQKMTSQLPDAETDNNLYNMAQEQESMGFNISTEGCNVLEQMEHLIRLLGNVGTPHGHDLLERTEASLRFVIAQFLIGRRNSNITGGSLLEANQADTQPPPYLGPSHASYGDFEFLQWDCDHVMSLLSDFFSSILAVATQQHPSVLTMFTLNVSSLSRCGLESVQEVLNRSSLESLNVVCTSFHPDLSDIIALALESVQWPTLKLLVLSGPKIDQWVQCWPLPTDPRLRSFHIQGTGTATQELSHSSALFIHQLAYLSPLMELHLENIQLEDKYDWEVIVDGIDPSVTKTIRNCI